MNNLHKIAHQRLTDQEISVLHWAVLYNTMYHKDEFRIKDGRLEWKRRLSFPHMIEIDWLPVTDTWATDSTMSAWIKAGKPMVTYEQLT